MTDLANMLKVLITSININKNEMNKTKFLTKKEAEESRKWHLIDADGKTFGRLCTEVATLLRGKHKPQYTPHNDCGDFVVIINAKNIKLTGKKHTDKKYYRHSGYIGGLKIRTAGEYLEQQPTKLIEKGVRGMLPKTKLGNVIIKKLKVYADSDHPHSAQQPQNYNFKFI